MLVWHLLCEFDDRALEGRYSKYALSSRIEVARVAEVLEARRPRGLTYMALYTNHRISVGST